MHHLSGEYDCKLDDKGRLKLPSQLMRQLSPRGAINFTINRGLETCLTLYTQEQWEQEVSKFQELSYYNEKQRRFLRYFFGGAAPVSTDAADRVNLPKTLMQWAGIEKEVVLISMRDRIEVWAKEALQNMRSTEFEEMSPSDLAELVFPKKNNAEEESA